MQPEQKEDLMKSFVSATLHYSKDSNLQVLMYSEIVPLLESHSAADVCFLCDITGNMEVYMEIVKETIKEFAFKISEIIKTNPRLAFVGFRDINDKCSLLVKDFTSNPEELIKAMDKVKCTGGDDVCEDIIKPLREVLKLTWKSDLMYVYILLDAPTHGKRYYEEKYHGYSDFDRYPNADKEELLEKLMCHYRRAKINLVLLQTNPRTNKMIQIMRRYYDSYMNKLSVINFEERKTMKEEFEKNFIQSMGNFAESRWNNFRKIKRKGDGIDAAPDLDEEAEFNIEFEGEVYSAFIEKIDFERKKFEYGLNIEKVHTEKCIVSGTKVGVGKFSKCQKLDVGGDPMYVIKIPKIPITNIKELTNDIEVSAFVEFFVQKFNTALDEKKHLIEKLDVVIIKNIDKKRKKIKGSTIYLAQRFVEGDYTKYNNNYGWVNHNETKANMIAQAFSHFTYEYSLGAMLVVDIQGVYNDDHLIITDPAIHSLLFKDRFGYTNHAKVGMLRFFRTHKCNDYCKQLKLLNLEPIKDLSSSELEDTKNKYKEDKGLVHLYEELDKKTKESQAEIKLFDSTVEINLGPIDEEDEDENDVNVTVISHSELSTKSSKHID